MPLYRAVLGTHSLEVELLGDEGSRDSRQFIYPTGQPV